jgi:hypothetical protein
MLSSHVHLSVFIMFQYISLIILHILILLKLNTVDVVILWNLKEESEIKSETCWNNILTCPLFKMLLNFSYLNSWFF